MVMALLTLIPPIFPLKNHLLSPPYAHQSPSIPPCLLLYNYYITMFYSSDKLFYFWTCLFITWQLCLCLPAISFQENSNFSYPSLSPQSLSQIDQDRSAHTCRETKRRGRLRWEAMTVLAVIPSHLWTPFKITFAREAEKLRKGFPGS